MMLPNLNKKLLISFILLGMTVLVYSQTGHHQFVNYDDGGYVYKNSNIQSPLGFKSIVWAFTTTLGSNWHPLTWLSHIIDFQLFGLNAGGHHLVSLLIHLANTLLLFFLFEKTTKGLWQSAFLAALFAVHPLHVESVAWIAERKDVLSTFFWILTLRTYVNYVNQRVFWKYLLVLFTFSLGLMAKPMVVTLPFVLLLMDFWPLGCFPHRVSFYREDLPARESRKSDNQGKEFFYLILEKIPFLLLSAASSAITFYAQQSSGAVNQFIPLMTRISNTMVSYLNYIGKALWPLNLSFFYPFPSDLTVWQIMGFGFLLCLISFGVFWYFKLYPYLIVGWLWYLGTLVPVIGLIQVGAQAMADRYTYIPLIGIFIMMSWGIPDLLAKWAYRKITLSVTGTVLLAIFMSLSWNQVSFWQNSNTLFQHALKVNPDNFKAHDMLGITLIGQGKLNEAMFHFREAIRLKPNDGSAQNNLGVALEINGKPKEAIAQYLKAVRVQPGFPEAHYNLGFMMAQQEEFEAAIFHFRETLKYIKKYPEVYNNLGVIFQYQGKIKEAVAYYSEALKQKPFFADAHFNLGTALIVAGRRVEAIQHFQEALRIQPGYYNIFVNMGLLQVQKEIHQETVALPFKRALVIDPNYLKGEKSLQNLLKSKEKGSSLCIKIKK